MRWKLLFDYRQKGTSEGHMLPPVFLPNTYANIAEGPHIKRRTASAKCQVPNPTSNQWRATQNTANGFHQMGLHSSVQCTMLHDQTAALIDTASGLEICQNECNRGEINFVAHSLPVLTYKQPQETWSSQSPSPVTNDGQSTSLS